LASAVWTPYPVRFLAAGRLFSDSFCPNHRQISAILPAMIKQNCAKSKQKFETFGANYLPIQQLTKTAKRMTP
jgi:hypothetical protein